MLCSHSRTGGFHPPCRGRTYRLSDGPLESNLATVSLTITPVNDAPVVADVQATTAEDTPLVIALGAYATDVDSTALTTQIVTGPAHGKSGNPHLNFKIPT